MFESAETVRMAQALARHSAERQAVVARNVANADTPGYRAEDVVPFAEIYGTAPEHRPRATRPGHFETPAWVRDVPVATDARAEPAPNGNSVSLEAEMIRAAEVRQSHGLALAVYKATLDLARAAIGRGR